MTLAHQVRLVPAFLLLSIPCLAAEGDRLTSRPRPPAPKIKPLDVGTEVRTATGQRRRVVLPDGSVVHVNEKTEFLVGGDRQLKLTAGEIHVDVAPRADAPFIVATPQREVKALGTSFGVRITEAGTAVVVTRGKVEVVNPADRKTVAVEAGQQLSPEDAKPTRAPRASHQLDWARELMIAAESPLVPASSHQGGSLTVVDPDGQEAKLSLRRYHVDVHIEDGFARTTIDQTYFNHAPNRLEGMFQFPLPADASLSRLAMYVDGTRMEGGMVERDHGRNVYESIVTKQQDPALLEWVDGTTFRMRVFPLEARQEKRIILSYTQRLAGEYGQETYRFPAGHTLDKVGQWTLNVRLKGDKETTWGSPSHALAERADGADRLLTYDEKNAKLDRDLVLKLSRPVRADKPRFSLSEHEGSTYLMMRYRPETGVRDTAEVSASKPRSWVFLFESSGDRDPLLARAQVEIIRGCLDKAGPLDRFAVISAGTRSRSPMKELQGVTPENVSQALAFLEGSHLIGALDLDSALAESAKLLAGAESAHLVHVGSGIAAMGEQRSDVLANRIPEGVTYVGVGVGRRWNRALMKSAAERTGGYFTQINPDEPIFWRAFETMSIVTAPRLLGVEVGDDGGKNRWLTFGGIVPHGEEVCAVTRLESKQVPGKVTVRGLWSGRPVEMTLPVEGVTRDAGYLPRTWARLEIDRLLSEDAGKHRTEIIDLSKSMYVMSPFTSLLVLENDAMYEQYKVDRGRKDHWASYDCPEKIEVFHEDEDGNRIDPKKLTKPTPKQVLDTISVRSAPGILVEGRARMQMLTSDLDVPPRLPSGGVAGARPRIRADSRPPILTKIPYLNHLLINDPMGVGGDGGSPYVSTLFTPMPDSPRYERGDANIGPERSRVSIVGRTVTSRNIILRQVPLSPGQPLSTPALREAERNLGRLNLFAADDGPYVYLFQSIAHANTGSLVFGLGGTQEPVFYERGVSRLTDRNELLYARPRYSGEDRLFFDLVAYAPGMNTGLADILAVLEAETTPTSADKPGRIDDAARKLLEKARQSGWRTFTLPGEDGKPGFSITFDGEGRHAYERSVYPGFREQVVCDGKQLRHLYPDLNLAAKRDVSRFHRLAFARMMPFALPRPEDLARGADLVALDERTVAIVPHGIDKLLDTQEKPIPYARVHLVFDADGNLREQQVVEMPAKKLLGRIVLGTEGTIRLLDGDGKELHTLQSTLKPAAPPELEPDTSKLVVLELPYRTRQHVIATRKLKDKSNDSIPFADALALLAADFATGNGEEMAKVFRESFHGRDKRQLGLYVLLAAAGLNLDGDHLDVLAEHRDEPLAQYLALHTSPVLRKHASQWAVGSVQWGDGALRHLAVTHSLLQRWGTPAVLQGGAKQRQDAINSALDYVEKNPNSQFGFALLGLMQARASEALAKEQNADDVFAALHRGWRHLAGTPGLETAVRYESARVAWHVPKERATSAKLFAALHEEIRKDGGLMLIDEDFRRALLGDGSSADAWNTLMRDTAKHFIAKDRRAVVLALARQCRELGDPALANDLLQQALKDIKERDEQLALTVAVVEFLADQGEAIEAERLLQPLLDDKQWTQRADLWRLARNIAGNRKMTARETECLERALDREYLDRPEVLHLTEVDKEYGTLLNHYARLAEAMVTLKVKAPDDFLAKVVRTADRWRSLSKNGTEACETVATILRHLGEDELAWDYLTTPVGQRPGESGPWLGLARELRDRGDLKTADMAFASAFAAEPTNAQILWDRAGNLRQSGNVVESRKLLRQLADGDWQPRFRPLAAQARWQLSQN